MKPQIGALVVMLTVLVGANAACNRSITPGAKNSLAQHTGESGSTAPKTHPPYYPNTSGNIVAPPGNPAGNSSGSPPIVGGTANQQGSWPEGR